MLKAYNHLNILARTAAGYFYSGEKRLPLLHCTFKKILAKNFAPGSPFHFIQAGAFDGVSHDFLFQFVKERAAKGIVIEPIADHFDKLQDNYSFNKAIVPVKSAIHSNLSSITLYRVDPKYQHQLPDWAPGITSIDPQHHLKTNIPSDMVVEEQVPARPLMELIHEYYTEPKINLLQIDTEGYDYEILRSFDFKAFVPDMVKIEYVNLTHADVNNCIALLKEHGYYCLYDQEDIIGLQLSVIRL